MYSRTWTSVGSIYSWAMISGRDLLTSNDLVSGQNIYIVFYGVVISKGAVDVSDFNTKGEI